MKAREGIRFLELLLKDPQSGMHALDLEKAIRLASECSPSRSFDRASQYWFLRHGRTMYYLGFAKGTRWLAMIRRDEGTDAFEAAVDQLRNNKERGCAL